jgi:hypothetical protein
MGVAHVMTVGLLNYDNGMYRARERPREAPRTKRKRAAELVSEGRRLRREALEDEKREAALTAEYGPPIRDE